MNDDQPASRRDRGRRGAGTAGVAPGPRRARGIEIVGECANGFEAVKVVSETKPDLLLLDVQMPKLDGFECSSSSVPTCRSCS
jgi:CheY-like chemotaxis protein